LVNSMPAASSVDWMDAKHERIVFGGPTPGVIRQCAFLNRTPAPPPFSSINSTPACSKARLIM
jgi:hypothetical protein